MDLEKLLTPKSNKKSHLVFYFIVVSLQHRGVAFTYLEFLFSGSARVSAIIQFSTSSSSTWCVAFLPPRSSFQLLLISGLIVFQYTIKQVHGLKTEYYLGVGDFIVAPRSFEFRDFSLSETLSMSEVRSPKNIFP